MLITENCKYSGLPDNNEFKYLLEIHLLVLGGHIGNEKLNSYKQ